MGSIISYHITFDGKIWEFRVVTALGDASLLNTHARSQCNLMNQMNNIFLCNNRNHQLSSIKNWVAFFWLHIMDDLNWFTFTSGFSYKIYRIIWRAYPQVGFFEIIESWIKVNNHHGRMIQKVQEVTKTANPNVSIYVNYFKSSLCIYIYIRKYT